MAHTMEPCPGPPVGPCSTLPSTPPQAEPRKCLTSWGQGEIRQRKARAPVRAQGWHEHFAFFFFFFSCWQQLVLHLGARGCDNYQNVYYVSLLIMQKVRQPPNQKERERQRRRARFPSSIFTAPSGPRPSPAHSPLTLPGWPWCRTRLWPPPVPGYSLLFLLCQPLQSRTELSPSLEVSRALEIQTSIQEAFQKIPFPFCELPVAETLPHQLPSSPSSMASPLSPSPGALYKPPPLQVTRPSPLCLQTPTHPLWISLPPPSGSLPGYSPFLSGL